MKRRISLLAVTLAMSACVVGPDFRQPASTDLPERFARASAARAGHVDGIDSADATFWRGFGDPLLSRMIGDALDANQDVRLAVSRYDASNALLAQAKFDRYPTVTANGEIGHQLLSRNQAFGAPRDARDTPISSEQFNATWELDLFGRVRRSVEASHADTTASAADIRAMRIAIVANVANAYVDLRGSQTRLHIARDNADNQRQTLALIEDRLAAGRGSDLDAARARAQFESTTSRIALYEASIGVDEHRLAVPDWTRT
ncbi:RND efflux system, outer membrane lipoprotein CmeC [Candidatus Burkholderia humilis]|nr:RND efflux system, outer membrane lipoprotein CmeC [Candidatus Burkholderia humilis]